MVDDQGRTGLFWASAGGHVAACRVLIDSGCDVNAADQSGCRPLHIAAETGNGKVVDMLLSGGASVGLVDGTYGVTALHLAAATGNVFIVRSILGVDKGVDLNATDKKGNTALHWAGHAGHAACAQALLQAGAAVDHADVSGNTALMLACDNGHEACALLLLKHGADADYKSEYGTPREIATEAALTRVLARMPLASA